MPPELPAGWATWQAVYEEIITQQPLDKWPSVIKVALPAAFKKGTENYPSQKRDKVTLTIDKVTLLKLVGLEEK